MQQYIELKTPNPNMETNIYIFPKKKNETITVLNVNKIKSLTLFQKWKNPNFKNSKFQT